MKAARRRASGVSLIEALVALAVMAFGVLGVVGIQATLRTNADVSRQRGEAVRFAQARIESTRAYVQVAAASGAGFADLSSRPAEPLSSAVANTTFTLLQTVTDTADGRAKTVRVDVGWRDRTSTTDNQTVSFGTLIARVPPELSGSLAMPGDASQLGTPNMRHWSIPLRAVPVDGEPGRSQITDVGGTIRYVFDNITGRIVSICDPVATCTPANAYLLAGYVRFATHLVPPTLQPRPAHAEQPPGPSVPPGGEWPAVSSGRGYVKVKRDDVADPENCIHFTVADAAETAHVAYYCAVPFSGTPGVWSGRSSVHPPGLATLAPVDESTRNDRFRVCRYAPVENPTRNTEHPRDYVNVTGPLLNQNFLIIRAGNDIEAFDCPRDDPLSPEIDGDTWLHQPLP